MQGKLHDFPGTRVAFCNPRSGMATADDRRSAAGTSRRIQPRVGLALAHQERHFLQWSRRNADPAPASRLYPRLDLIRSMSGDPLAPMFVLAVASSQHSLEAFDLGVVDYILKPFTEDRVDQCLRRLLDRRAPRPQAVRRVVARRKKALVFLDPEKIWAFEAADRLTFVHSAEGRFDIDLSLAAIEASFGRALFRVHRNWLVNLAYVKELERDIGGATVSVGSDLGPEGRSIRAPVSQDRAKALRDVLLENTTGLRRP